MTLNSMCFSLMRAAIILITILVASPAVGGDKPYVVGFGFDDSGYPDMSCFKSVIREAYKRIGIPIRFGNGVLQRDIQNARRRLYDATAYRSPVGVRYEDNLIQVPVLLYHSPFSLFTMNPNLRPTGWNDIKSLRVGILKGLVDATCQTRNAGVHPHVVTSIKAGFQMLATDRLDVFIAETTMAHEVAISNGFDDLFISKPLFHVDIYHYVHRKHADLVPLLTQTFEDMLKDGTVERILGKHSYMLTPPATTDCLDSPNSRAPKHSPACYTKAFGG